MFGLPLWLSAVIVLVGILLVFKILKSVVGTAIKVAIIVLLVGGVGSVIVDAVQTLMEKF